MDLLPVNDGLKMKRLMSRLPGADDVEPLEGGFHISGHSEGDSVGWAVIRN